MLNTKNEKSKKFTRVEIDLNSEKNWKPLPIKGYEHYYVSTDGQVWNSTNHIMLKQSVSNVGYLQVSLKDSQHRQIVSQVGRLVALTWVNNPDTERYTEVMHLNNDKFDNRAVNLSWGDRKLNCNQFDFIEKQRVRMLNNWQNPEFADKMNKLRNAAIRKFFADPEKNQLRIAHYKATRKLNKEKALAS